MMIVDTFAGNFFDELAQYVLNSQGSLKALC